MQQKDQNIFTYFSSIGKSDNLQTVSSRCTKPNRVIHSQQKYKPNGFKNNILQKTNQNHQIHHQLKHKAYTSLKKNTIVNKQKQERCFWPTDIIHDETGNALKQLKSYIETHKINTYIKLNLSQNKYKNIKKQQIKQLDENKNINREFQIKNKEQQRKTKKKQNKTVPVLYSNFNQPPIEDISIIEEQKDSPKNKKEKVIKIDYQVIKISKNKHKNKNGIVHYNSQQLNNNRIEAINNQNNKNTNTVNKKAHHSNHIYEDAGKINRKYSHNIISNIVSEEYLGKYETPMHGTHHCQCQCICIKNSKNRYMHASTKPTIFVNLDIHQKQYLTPNTSTYFNTINSVDLLNSDRHHYQNNSQNSKNQNIKVRTMNKNFTNSKEYKYFENSTKKSQIINGYLSNGKATKDIKNGQQNKNFLNQQQYQKEECPEQQQYDSKQDKTNENKNKYMGSNIKRFQRNFGMTNSSLNYNSYAYNKDTKSAMKMSVPI